MQLADGRPPTPQERELFDAIGLRHTSRVPFSGQPIPEAVQIGLEQQADFELVLLRMLSAQDAAAVLELAASADRKLAANFDHRVEFGQWIGITGDDGAPASALGYRHGVATSFLYQPIESRDIEQPEHDWWPWPECPQSIIRFGYRPPGATRPGARVPRSLTGPAESADVR